MIARNQVAVSGNSPQATAIVVVMLQIADLHRIASSIVLIALPCCLQKTVTGILIDIDCFAAFVAIDRGGGEKSQSIADCIVVILTTAEATLCLDQPVQRVVLITFATRK